MLPASRRGLGLLCLLLTAVPAAADPGPKSVRPSPRLAVVWKINTHLFAANKALADALDDGRVTIPPFGEFAVSPAALRALRAAPSAYRAGVLAPDLFPDMYVGGWFIHSDLSQTSDRWTANDWMRHVWSAARAWDDAGERDKVLAFAYGFLTHGAGDIFAHTYVNQKADGAWITFTGPARSTAVKHVVLEGYVGIRTPPTDLTLDVWPRLVVQLLIKDPAARAHAASAVHYQKWLAIYDWLGPQIDRAKDQMDANVPAQAPYWVKCAANPVPCARKEQMETWRRDINRGLRALVDSSQTLGERLMAHQPSAGVGAMTGWMKEWTPKMFGAHAVGEGAKALEEFLQWIGDPLAPINAAIMAEVMAFLQERFPQHYALYQSVQDPAYQMDHVGFPSGTRQLVDREMGIARGTSRWFDWRAFEPIYNSVILSKLVLLDGAGLNELARRAGVAGELYPPSEDVNIMLGVFRSMTQSYQWMGEVVRADTGSHATRFGICGPEGGDSLPTEAPCGIQRRFSGPRAASAVGRSAGGFPFWGHPDARDKIFGRIFKGHGPGPGPTTDFADPSPAPAAVRVGARGLTTASGEAESMREIVAVMRGKIAGVAPATTTGRKPSPSGRLRTPAPAPAIAGWGRRCCAGDVAAIRNAMTSIQATGRLFLNPTVVRTLGRKSNLLQLHAYLAQLNGALTAFEETNDARTAGAALDSVANQIDALARLVNGVR